MVLYGRGLRGRPAGQAVVAEVEDAIDIYFKSSSPGDDVTKGQPKDYSCLQNTSSRISRSRPVIPPLLELHLIQLGNKLTIGEAEVARARFRRAVSVASLGPLSASSSSHDFVTSCTDPEGNAVQSRATPGHPGANSVPRARCCNCPESGVAATDVVVDQLVRMMRKVVLDIMDDNATTTLLRARVPRQKLTPTVRDDRIRSSSSSSLSSSCSSSSSSSVSKVAVITPANEANSTVSAAPAAAAVAAAAVTPSAEPPAAPAEFPSATSTPTCSSPSSLFSSPSSSSSSGEKRREGEGATRPDLRLPSPCNNEEEESSAFGAATEVASPPTPSRVASEIKHIEPIFLRCPKRVEENLAASHSFVRAREGGVVPPLRGSMSPRPKKTSHTTAGDELQMRLNAILHTSKRDCVEKNLRNCSASPRIVADGRLDDCQVPCPSSPVSQSSLSPYHYQLSGDRSIDSNKAIENGETTMSFYDDASSHPFSLNYESAPDHPSSPIYHSPHPSSPMGNPVVGMPPPSHPPGNHMESHSSWRDSEDELQRTCGPMYAKPPRYSIFTISGTLTDPFGTNAKYSLRSLSTAHF
ncbi:uncharacterized protein [Macrobrachium rosenbergii]|uniref:uncharacterized protein n=1 Tax=Macrobrachium rosenbergii TaxID=79674 RepID=UPI0034D5D422